MVWLVILFILCAIVAFSALAEIIPQLLKATFKILAKIVKKIKRLSAWISKKVLAPLAKKRWAKAHEAWAYNKSEYEKQKRELAELKKAKALLAYKEAKNVWQLQVAQIKEKHRQLYEIAYTKWQQKVDYIRTTWQQKKDKEVRAWKDQIEIAERVFREESLKVKKLKSNFIQSDSKAIQTISEEILRIHHKQYNFIAECSTQYLQDNRMLIIDCRLPSPDNLPTLREKRYIKSRNEFKEVHLSSTEVNKFYDEILYKLVLADIAQVFSIKDSLGIIDSIVFNGYVKTTSKSTGNKSKACILSIHTDRIVFSKLNLLKVDAKECFKFLKGVGSSKLYDITPVPPIMKISMEDKRFIQAYDVAYSLSEATNLAAMDWQDFEHLVREIFQKMFSSNGVEVKVTQSSRDKGVDAIAFDPDPLRGGKIVIQAKRYTNVVGVSAVRDLWGTVMNEGAMKGVLVTTSNFGSDAYDFVKGKPLTLISGGELLSFLSQKGYKAKIDISEAKKILYD